MDPFDPEDITWQRVSPKLATSRRLVTAVGALVPAALVIVLAVLTHTSWVYLFLAPVLAVTGWVWWLVGRRARAVGYAERADDLLVRRGILVRNLVVVPYGRMQYVDVRSGPVDRWFKIANVQLHTASPGTDAHIPGLPMEEAARLRDRLARRGEAHLAGL
jgi:membrane protein YdbS with pleckstrin-like domain